jgi:hypothetical protein
VPPRNQTVAVATCTDREKGIEVHSATKSSLALRAPAQRAADLHGNRTAKAAA